MRTVTKLAAGAGGMLALLVGVGWLGLQIEPQPFPPHPEGTGELDTAELPSDLPEPVQRHFRATLGEEVPQIETAVVWGRGEFNFFGLVWFPMRLKSYHIAEREFRRDLE